MSVSQDGYLEGALLYVVLYLDDGESRMQEETATTTRVKDKSPDKRKEASGLDGVTGGETGKEFEYFNVRKGKAHCIVHVLVVEFKPMRIRATSIQIFKVWRFTSLIPTTTTTV